MSGGFHDQDFNDRSRTAKLEARLDTLTVDDLFQPIVSCSTVDKKVVELLVDGRVMTGCFDSDKGHWLVNGGTVRIPEGLYPSHWRPLKP